MKTFDEKTTIIICSLGLMFLNISYILSSSQVSMLPGWSIIENLMIAASIILAFFKMVGLKIYIGNDGHLFTLLVLIAIIISAISFVISGGPTVMKLFLFAFVIKDVPRKHILKIHVSSLLIGVLFVVLLSFLGLLDARWDDGSIFTLGFKNPNNLPVFFSGIIFTYNILKKDDLRVSAILVELICTTVLYVMTTSRTATVINIIVLFLTLFYKKYNGNIVTRLLQNLSFVGFWIYAFISLFIASQFSINSERWRQLNLYMSWRPYLYQRYFLRYGISIFGNAIDKTSLGTLDNAYLVLMIQYGIFTLIIYGIVFFVLARHAKEEQDMTTTILIVGYELFFLFEFVPLLINVNAVLLEFLIVYLNGNDSLEDGQKEMNGLLSEVYDD